MILYFVRHGQAGEQRAVDDEGRELTADGISASRGAVPLWRRLNLRPDLVLSSPLARARQTAELFCSRLDAPTPVVDETLAPRADWGSFARGMVRAPNARRVLFVRHEPDLSSTVALLTGAASVRVRPSEEGWATAASGIDPPDATYAARTSNWRAVAGRQGLPLARSESSQR